MLSGYYVFMLYIFKYPSEYFQNIEANSMNPDQTAPIGAV